MPQNTTIDCAALSWTLLTNNDVTALRVANLGVEPVWLEAAVGAVPPTDTLGALPLRPGEILAADLTLAQLFPGIAGANRVYVYCPVASKMSVSHA